MWILLALGAAILISVPAVGLLVRGAVARLEGQPWLLYDTAKLHVTIMGGLAGFAVTGIVLIVGLTRSSGSAVFGPELDTVVVMFVVAYFYYVGNAFLISYLPHRDLVGDLVPRVHFSLISTIEYRTLFVSWFALMPLLRSHGLDGPADFLAILLPASLLVGSVIISMAADGLGLVSIKETYIALVVAALLALTYAAVVWFNPWLRSAYSSMEVALAVFAINGLGYALAALTPLAPRYPGVEKFYVRHGRSVVLFDMQLTMCSLGFLWLAVVGAI